MSVILLAKANRTLSKLLDEKSRELASNALLRLSMSHKAALLV